MYNPGKTTADNVVPLNSKSTKKPKTNHKKKSRENITIIPSKVNDVFNRVPIKETYCKLVMLADESGTLIIRIRTLAKFLNTGEKTISRNLKELHIRGLIIKDRFIDEYGYQKMIIHIVNYNKLAEKDTHVGKPGQDVVGQLVNNQLYDRDTVRQITTKQLYETLPFSNKLTKDYHELTNKIYESGTPLIEEQMFDKRIKTDDRKAHASEHDIILTNQPPLPSHKPTASVSGAVSYISEQTSKQKTKQTNVQDVDYLVRLIMGFGTREGQAKQMIDTYGYDVVLDKVNYIKSLEGIDRKGGYLMAVLKAHGKKNGIAPPHKPATPEEKQASEDRKKLCQEHWENIDNFWKKNYKSFELYQNTRLDEHKGIIFKTLEILNSNPSAYPNKPLYEYLNSQTITASNLRIICDRLIGENPTQLMGENKTSQEPSKNIVPEPIEKTNKSTVSSSPEPAVQTSEPSEKPAKEALRDIITRTNGTNNVMAKVLAAKKQTSVNKVEQNRMVNEAFIEYTDKMELQQKVTTPVIDAKTTSKSVDQQLKEAIDDRQQIVIDYLKNNGSGALRDFETLLGLSKASVKILLKKMRDSNTISSHGSGRSLYYRLIG